MCSCFYWLSVCFSAAKVGGLSAVLLIQNTTFVVYLRSKGKCATFVHFQNNEHLPLMPNFAHMEHVRFDYADENIQFVTTFEELAHLDTASLDGYLILACNSGRLEVDVNGSRKQLKAFEALILPPRTHLTNHMGSPGVRCDLAFIATAVARKLLGGHMEEWDRCLYVHKTNHVVADESEQRQFAGYVDLLSFKLQQHNRRYHREVMESLLRSILFDYLEMMTAAVPQAENATSEGQHKVLFKRFLELLTARHVKHQLVDTYAQELCVSPNYLTKVCREVTGKTALQWIREHTEADIRYYLLNSDMSIKEICDDLGFPNLSFFGKYCRRAFGLSPNEFRKQHRTAAKPPTSSAR